MRTPPRTVTPIHLSEGVVIYPIPSSLQPFFFFLFSCKPRCGERGRLRDFHRRPWPGVSLKDLNCIYISLLASDARSDRRIPQLALSKTVTPRASATHRPTHIPQTSQKVVTPLRGSRRGHRRGSRGAQTLLENGNLAQPYAGSIVGGGE